MTNPSSDRRLPPIVGVGASAGGLEAFQEFLGALDVPQNLAIVFVQHLDPSRKSLLTELLAKSTKLNVIELSGRQKLAAGAVYVCPPKTLLELNDGVISCYESNDRRPVGAIDHFFHSLAEDQGERGIGVILSGTGSDGTQGLKAISDHGGLTFAQDAESAKYDSMPRSAATTGVADHVLSPTDIAYELLKYVAHLVEFEQPATQQHWQENIKYAIPLIAQRLMDVTQHNFQHYKFNTLTRRILRRMQVLKIGRVSDYVDLLGHDADEVRALFRELLTGVTAFFRDPEAFQSLRTHVLPKLFVNRTLGDCVRIWVAGCANGQEAYTIAMLCREVMDEVKSPCDVQIFATDIDERALATARAGNYSLSIEDQISPERLKRFFVKKAKRYHVTKAIRELVLFSVHNLISDPPFSRQDLISCRNLLIYLGPHLQNKLIPLFHYALRPSGFLFLGPSENITSHGELFRPLDAKQRISQRKGTGIGSSGSSRQYSEGLIVTRQGSQIQPDVATDLSEMRHRITCEEFAPKSVVVDEDGQILNASADMQNYLTVSGGNYQNNIIKMAARGLRIGLRAAITEAKKQLRRVDHEDLSIRVGDLTQRVMITVQPMPTGSDDDRLFLVVFRDLGKPFKRNAKDSSGSRQDFQSGDDETQSLASSASADAIVTQLERELEMTREDLDKTLQDMEAAHEELKSSNEELLSMNEELQSVNEELQSANEELETSKEEIRAGSDEVARAKDDLENLLRSSQIATVFLDDRLNIRSFTPAIAEIYDLIPTDIGRPLDRFVPLVHEMPPLPDSKLVAEIARPFDRHAAKSSGRSTTKVLEHTVLAHSGKSFIRRVLPYQSHTGDSEGIVVTFNDVTQLHERAKLSALNTQLAVQLSGMNSLENILQECCQQFVDELDVAFARVWLHDQSIGVLNLVASAGICTHLDGAHSRIPMGEYKIGRIAQQQRPLLTNHVVDDPNISDPQWAKQEGMVAFAGCPLIISGKTVGVLAMFSQHEFSEVAFEHLQPMSVAIAQCIARKDFERELIVAKQRLELTFQVTEVAPWNWDAATEDIVSSPMLNRLFAFPDDAQPKVADFLAGLVESDRDRVVDALQRTINEGNDYDIDYQIIRPTGETRHVRAVGKPQFSDDGRFVDFIGVAIDITERKQHELELAQREAHLRRVINNQLGLVGVIDRDGLLVEIDDRSLAIARTRREDVVANIFPSHRGGATIPPSSSRSEARWSAHLPEKSFGLTSLCFHMATTV